MKIYTGNFANAKKYVLAGLTPVSIARFNRYFSGLKYPTLAPPAEIIHDEINEYIPKYNEYVISKLNPKVVFKELETITDGNDVILLCYEKAGDFCHRRLVAAWLEKNLSIQVDEFNTKVEQPKLL